MSFDRHLDNFSENTSAESLISITDQCIDHIASDALLGSNNNLALVLTEFLTELKNAIREANERNWVNEKRYLCFMLLSILHFFHTQLAKTENSKFPISFKASASLKPASVEQLNKCISDFNHLSYATWIKINNEVAILQNEVQVIPEENQEHRGILLSRILDLRKRDGCAAVRWSDLPATKLASFERRLHVAKTLVRVDQKYHPKVAALMSAIKHIQTIDGWYLFVKEQLLPLFAKSLPTEKTQLAAHLQLLEHLADLGCRAYLLATTQGAIQPLPPQKHVEAARGLRSSLQSYRWLYEEHIKAEPENRDIPKILLFSHPLLNPVPNGQTFSNQWLAYGNKLTRRVYNGVKESMPLCIRLIRLIEDPESGLLNKEQIRDLQATVLKYTFADELKTYSMFILWRIFLDPNSSDKFRLVRLATTIEKAAKAGADNLLVWITIFKETSQLYSYFKSPWVKILLIKHLDKILEEVILSGPLLQRPDASSSFENFAQMEETERNDYFQRLCEIALLTPTDCVQRPPLLNILRILFTNQQQNLCAKSKLSYLKLLIRNQARDENVERRIKTIIDSTLTTNVDEFSLKDLQELEEILKTLPDLADEHNAFIQSRRKFLSDFFRTQATINFEEESKISIDERFTDKSTAVRALIAQKRRVMIPPDAAKNKITERQVMEVAAQCEQEVDGRASFEAFQACSKHKGNRNIMKFFDERAHREPVYYDDITDYATFRNAFDITRIAENLELLLRATRDEFSEEDQSALKELIALHKQAKERAAETTTIMENSKEREFYVFIVQNLTNYFAAAKAVSTDQIFVDNTKAGLALMAGATVSKFIPLVGGAVSALCDVGVALDRMNQKSEMKVFGSFTVTNNFAELFAQRLAELLILQYREQIARLEHGPDGIIKFANFVLQTIMYFISEKRDELGLDTIASSNELEKSVGRTLELMRDPATYEAQAIWLLDKFNLQFPLLKIEPEYYRYAAEWHADKVLSLPPRRIDSTRVFGKMELAKTYGFLQVTEQSENEKDAFLVQPIQIKASKRNPTSQVSPEMVQEVVSSLSNHRDIQRQIEHSTRHGLKKVLAGGGELQSATKGAGHFDQTAKRGSSSTKGSGASAVNPHPQGAPSLTGY